MYWCWLFPDKQIMHIVDNVLKSVQGFEKYVNLKSLKMSSLNKNSDLSSISGLALREIILRNYNDDLSPLTGMMSLQKIHMESFKGDLSPLKGLPLQEIYMRNYKGSIEVLRGAPISSFSMSQFDDEIEPIANPLLEKVYMVNFKGNLGPLSGLPLKSLEIWNYDGDFEPLDNTTLEVIDVMIFDNKTPGGRFGRTKIKRNQDGKFKNFTTEEIGKILTEKYFKLYAVHSDSI